MYLWVNIFILTKNKEKKATTVSDKNNTKLLKLKPCNAKNAPFAAEL